MKKQQDGAGYGGGDDSSRNGRGTKQQADQRNEEAAIMGCRTKM